MVLVVNPLWRERFAKSVLEHLDRLDYLVVPHFDGKRVRVWPVPPLGTQLDLMQARGPLKKLVHARDRWAQLLFEAAERVGATLWFDRAKRSIVIGILEGDPTPRHVVIDEDEARAFLRQLSALWGLIAADLVAMSCYCRRTMRTSPPADLSEVMFEFSLPRTQPWIEPTNLEELEVRLAAVKVELAEAEARLRARRKARRLA